MVSSSSILKRVAIGGVAFTAAMIATLGLYGHHAETFHDDTGRLLAEITSSKGIQVTMRDSKGLNVHGILIPKASAASGELAFDGRLSYDFIGEQYNFTLLNDRAYMTIEDLKTGKLSRNACVHPENIPPISTLTEALKHGRIVDAVGNDKLTCPTGKMIEFDFAGEPYVICTVNPAHGSSADSPGTVKVVSDDLEASLTLLRDNSEGVPSLASLAPPAGLDLSTCDAVTPTSGDASLITSSVAAKTSRALQRTQDAFQVLTGGRRLSKTAREEYACTCKGGFKQCLFVHGLGYNASASTSQFPNYFGTMEQQTQCCWSTKFLHIDTLNSPWYDDASTEALCSEALKMSGGKDKMAIEGVAVIAHSMGNLVFQAALMNNKCALAKSSKYIALAGPIYGSMSATSGVSIFESFPKALQERLCYNDPNTKIDDAIVNALLFFGLCPSRRAIKSIVFKGSKESTPELDALFTAAGQQYKKSVSSSLCGVNPKGLATTDSIQLSVLGTTSGHASSENDGQVDFGSCRATLSPNLYSTSWNGGNYYKASINHLDASFRNGDGWWGEDRKPIKWFNCQF